METAAFGFETAKRRMRRRRYNRYLSIDRPAPATGKARLVRFNFRPGVCKLEFVRPSVGRSLAAPEDLAWPAAVRSIALGCDHTSPADFGVPST